MTLQPFASIGRSNGLFARHEALAQGFTEREFRQLTHGLGSPWVRVRYGIYTSRSGWSALDDEGRQGLVDQAALLVCDAGTILSHTSAARLHGLPVVGVRDGLTHVTRLRTGGRRVNRVEGGIKHHCIQLEPQDVTVVRGIAVTQLVRTVLDVPAEYGYEVGMVTADAALQMGLAPDVLAAALLRRESDPSWPTLRAVVADARIGVESPLETVARIRLTAMGIDDLVLQFPVFLEPGREVRVDLYSERLRHIFECDGRLKYDDVEGSEVGSDVLWREKRREDRLRGLGFGLTRLTWADLMPERARRLEARVRREITLQSGQAVTLD